PIKFLRRRKKTLPVAAEAEEELESEPLEEMEIGDRHHKEKVPPPEIEENEENNVPIKDTLDESPNDEEA
ncbi:MAG: hypothetical protein NT033_03080, partial [Candidatus Omnitrophica bacterium]|nr:hypothetical protein [Candidatus Omnitrophota bacterium]